jgi:hypothetical protein
MTKRLITSLQWVMTLVVLAGCSADVSGENLEVQLLAQEISFDGSCTADHQSTVSLANYFAYLYTQKALNAFRATPDSDTSKRWFGNQGGGGKEIIRSVFERTLDQFAGNDTKFYCDCGEQLTYAKSWNLQPQRGVTLCDPLYWNAPGIGVNSQAGIIAHEFTHTAADTDDITDVYGDAGPPTALNLAIERPRETPYNAVSYQYFIEETAFQ